MLCPYLIVGAYLGVRAVSVPRLARPTEWAVPASRAFFVHGRYERKPFIPNPKYHVTAENLP